MVDWSLARQVAGLAAGSGEPGPDPDVVAVSAEMEEHVAAYTRLRPATPVPGAELVSREEWASINLETLSRLVEAFREGGLAALVQTREQRGLIERAQATMAVVEGYSEHAMDEIGRDVIPEHEKLRSAMDARRRSRSAPQRIVERLLGFDVKLRQYELGKRFCDAVAASAGIDGLNRVCESPQALPTADELEAPEAWLERVGPAPAAAA